MRLFIPMIVFSFLLSQNIWNGVSVATPDNLDAVSTNPAGLGINRGEQSGTYLSFDSKYTNSSSFRSNGLGYDLTYNIHSHGLFNPEDGNIGFGFSPVRNFYTGIKWNKHSLIDLGFLYRPFNFISIGSAHKFSDDFEQYEHSTYGIAIRPLFNHRITIGADYNDMDLGILTYHFSSEIINGILLSGTWNATTENEFQVNLGFNLGKQTAYSSSSINSNIDSYSGGLGFYSDTQISKSIFNKKAKDKQKYVRMKLSGRFIEEKPYDPPFNFNIEFSPFGGNTQRGIQLRKWIDYLNELTEDDEINGLIIDMGLVRAGWAKRGEIHTALSNFKNAGKKIIVYADKGIANADYYLISMADEIYINELTGIDLKGLSIEITFLRGLLDTLYIEPEVFRVEYDGKSYKTAGDQFLNKKMSEEMRENYTDLLDDFYNTYIQGISNGRGWTISETENIINNGPFITSHAIENGLADSIMYPDQFNDYIKSINDKKIDIIKWDNIDRSVEYVTEWAPCKKDKIAIIYAVGGIVSGKSNPGPAGSSMMGDKTIIESIKSARENDEVKAILLRIDSGGGSALASDQMWREILKTTDLSTAKTKEDSAKVKPFIASMSDVAASGGYYIACQADTIIAHPSTVTGSIGVIGTRLNLSKLMNKWGITSDLIKRGEYSDFASGNRLIKEEERKKIQESINETYSQFKDKVIKGRNISSDLDLDQVAMGRVFTGERAKNNIAIPLVDVNGGLHDAIELTKSIAGLTDKEVDIIEYPMPQDKLKEIAKNLAKFNKIEYKYNLPENLAREFEVFDIIPIMINDEIQVILPYDIKVQ